MRVNTPSGRLAVALVAGCMAVAPGVAARAASWHLVSSFGKSGVAGLPVREEGIDFLYPPGPGDNGSLLAPGPQESLFVGGYANRAKGSLLLARISAQGKLVTSFGRGGVSTAPAIYSTPQRPPRMFALGGGKLLIVGLDRADHFVAVRLTDRGQADRAFGHDGVAQYELPDTHGHAIVAAATVEHDGDILAVYYQKEAPQPKNQPRIAPGLGEGPIELVRLLPSGALDRTFGQAGFLKATGQPPSIGEGSACSVTIAPDGSILLAYEQAAIPNGDLAEVPAVQELSPTGADASGFGVQGVAYLPFTPTFQGVSSALFGGLFALGGGAVEVSFGGGGQLFRFTPTGTPDPAFGTSGHSTAGPAASAMAAAPDGETFSVDNAGALTVGGTLANGTPDPALGGRKGERFTAKLPARRPNEEQQALELLAGNDSLSILVGEDVVRISR